MKIFMEKIPTILSGAKKVFFQRFLKVKKQAYHKVDDSAIKISLIDFKKMRLLFVSYLGAKSNDS